MSTNNTIKAEEMSSFFNLRAEGYDNHMEETVSEFDTFYNRVSEPMTETMEPLKIIDLGCGTGLELTGIFKRIPNAAVTGLDMSENMLSLLRDKHRNHMVQLKLIKGSYLTFEYPENFYDYAVSVMTMHHWTYDVKLNLYSNIRSALKAGGMYIEGDYMVELEKEQWLLAEYEKQMALVDTKNSNLYHIDIPFSIDTQKELLYKAGFRKVNVLWQSGEATILMAEV
jgi:tRNA (cmo5U34)-methyltransferase